MMKVLLITKGEPDYQSDCLLHGLYSLLGEDFTHSCDYPLMYKGLTPKEELLNGSGRGFTMWDNLPTCFNDNKDLENKIKNRYFNLIIYGSCRRNLDYIDIVRANYSKNEIAFVDGEDDTNILNTHGYPLFKRELVYDSELIFPISFAIPAEKIATEIIPKTKKLADYKPSSSGTGYIYNSEEDYYYNYKEALYALTHKKGGWDCMRHYEILANNCIPYFVDLQYCPPKTMANFPKEHILKSNQLFETESNEAYDILNYIFEYTKKNLTTLSLAKYVIDSILNISSVRS